MSRGNSFIAKKLRWRNFMSFGDNETELDLTGQDIAVLLGENLDSKSEDARNGVGKSQPLGSKVLTPDGWRLMGDLKIGDKVISAGGRAVRITGITDDPEPFGRYTYAITTVDGRRARATSDHAWTVLTSMKKPRNLNSFFAVDHDDPLQWRTLTTQEILEGLESGHEFHLPLHKPPRAPKADDLDPWHTGMVAEHDERWTRPPGYNAAQRYMYLKGMLGYAKKGKNASMPSVGQGKTVRSEHVAREIQETVWSLGGTCSIDGPISEAVHVIPGEAEKLNGSWIVAWEVQNPNHKYQEQTVQIKEVREDGMRENVRCLLIDDPSHLYVTDDYIVTHNSTVVDALCFVLFGKTIRDSTNQRLINRWVPKRPMYVELEFDKGDYEYLVERGERPSKLKLYRKPRGETLPFRKKDGRKFIFDISRGKTETTKQIEELLGYSITLFGYIAANSSESDPFPKLKPPQQRDLMEKLFGFEIMSQKGAVIAEQRKETKKLLAAAESALSMIIQANERIRAQIADIERRSTAWVKEQSDKIDRLLAEIAKLEGIDYDKEIENQKLLAEVQVESDRITAMVKQAGMAAEAARRIIGPEEYAEGMLIQNIEKLDEETKHMAGGVCPTCEQAWTPDPKKLERKSEELVAQQGKLIEQRDKIKALFADLDEKQKALEAAEAEMAEFDTALEGIANLEVHFDTIEQALEAKSRITNLQDSLREVQTLENPHTATLEALNDEALQDEDDTEVQQLRKLVKHQDYMVRLLTDSDSFVRKQILDQWVPALNKQIQYYMDHFDKPHLVQFQPDLTLKITLLSEEFFWGDLSKGERVSITLSLNMAFQDIFEFLNYGINIFCIDELLDNGLGPGEARAVVEVLKRLNHIKQKSILLITHREDIAAQADRTFMVRKEAHLSRIEQVQ